MYESATYEVILQRMLDRVSDQFDKRAGSVIWDTHSPTAIEFQVLYIELDNILKEAYGDTASREFLIRRCKERGIEPEPATYAVLKGEFTPTTVDVLGKRFNIGAINYVVTEKIADGEYQVQCETAGIVGNQQLGTMIPIEYVNGLETAQLTSVLIPGEDEEETEVLRNRYFASFSMSAFGGNVADYLNKTNAIDGVGATKVTRVWNNDIKPSEMIPNSRVQTWYNGIISSLSADVKDWLTAVYTAALNKLLTTGGTVLLTIINSDYDEASSTLVQTVQEIIDPEQNAGEGSGLAPIGHVVKVRSAIRVSIVVKTTITFDTGYSWSNLQNSIDEVIKEYLLELRKDWADAPYLIVRISQIESRLLNLTGIVDITATKINGVAENYTLGMYEIPVYGGASG